MTPTQKLISCLSCQKKSSCFKALDKKALKELEENRVELRFSAGEIICKQGAFANQIAYINKGLIKIYTEINEDANLIINVFPEGKLIGLPFLYHQKTCNYSAAAIEDSTICSIDIQLFDKYIRTNGDFAQNVICELNKNTASSYKRLIALTYKQLNGRIADTLLYLANEIYESDEFLLSLSRKDLAELSRTSSESITRIFSKFRNDKMISLKEGYLKILNKESLEKISNFG